MTDILIKFNDRRQSNDESLATEPAIATESAVKSLTELNSQISILQIKLNQQTQLWSFKKNINSQIQLIKTEQLQIIYWCVDNSHLYQIKLKQNFHDKLCKFLLDMLHLNIKDSDCVLRCLVKAHWIAQAVLKKTSDIAYSEINLEQALDEWIKIINEVAQQKTEASAANTQVQDNYDTACWLQKNMMIWLQKWKWLEDSDNDSEDDEDDEDDKDNEDNKNDNEEQSSSLMKDLSVQDSSVQDSSAERISDQVWKWSYKQDCDKQKIQEIELLNKNLESALKNIKDALFILTN